MDKINVAELLKDCPKGMELDCVMYENLYFDYIDNNKIYPIYCYTEDNLKAKHPINFTWYGQPSQHDSAKCVIFPKNRTTWEGFAPPCKFRDGDILYVKAAFDWICIYKESEDTENVYKYVAVLRQQNATSIIKDTNCLCYRGNVSEIRLATEEEKEKLFKAIKDNGYRWNAETKTLEKMIKDKFDINTLKPYESKVLARDNKTETWKPAYWGFYDETNSINYPYETVGGNCFSMSIPYENNEHLLGTTDDCDEFYKTW